ncbi:VCBS domain-containing protein [Gilvimarinus agarilyticus]|uniref:VCBS domain-containing protein n=1 Tax=Gilvimarinus agarilyticus TaxID=679259 RepID=UPI00059FB450|nr:VCBS domain-containing protein [Gilvimarinus agarilyticus]
MSELSAVVVEIEGRAWARTPEGVVRNLAEGDTLLPGERVVVERGARISIDFGDAQPLTLDGPQQLLLNADLWSSVSADEAAVAELETTDTAPETFDSSESANPPATDPDEADVPLSQGRHYSVNLKRVGEELTPPGLDGSQVPERPEPPYTLGGRVEDEDGPIPPLPPQPPVPPNPPPVPNFPPQTADQYLTTPEDVPLPGGIPGYDPEGAPLSYTVVSGPEHGTVELDPVSGAFVYTPDEDYNGDDKFVVELSDGRYTVTETTYIEVTPVNDPPEAIDQYLTTPEDTAIDGQLEASDVDGDTLSYRILTPPANGQASIDPNTGAFTYEPGPDYVGNDQFTVLVDDGQGGTTEAVVYIEVTPVEDTPIFNGDDTGEVIEDSDDPLLRDNGKLDIEDADEGEAFFVPGNAVAGTGALGVLSITAEGAWDYQVANADVQYLAQGQSISETHTVSAVDGTTHDVVVTITGVNDVPVISVAAGDRDSASLNETNASLSAVGTLSVADVDLLDTVAPTVLSVSSNGPTDTLTNAQLLAMLSVDAGDIIAASAQTGTLSWQFNSGVTTFDFLPQGAGLTLDYLVQVTDSNGATADHVITIQITGTDDTPIFTGGDRGVVTEDASDPDLVINGQLTGRDPDGGQTSIDTSIAPQPSPGALGSFTIASDGVWTYTIANADVQYLAQNELRTEFFIVTTADGTEHPITLVIRGTNDAPEISVVGRDKDTVILVEGDAALNSNGTLTATDIDVRDVGSVAVTGVTFNLPINVDPDVFLAMFSVDAGSVIASGVTDGVINWAFDSGSETFDALPGGARLRLQYTVELTDSRGATDQHVVNINIIGTNDKPVFTGGDTGAVTEDVAVDTAADTLNYSDQLTGFDVDYGQAQIDTSIPPAPFGTVHGSLTIQANGVWDYQVDNAVVQYLSAREVTQDIFNVTTVDGAVHAIVVDITGTNDLPVISVSLGDSDAEALVETDSPLTTNGTLSVTDIDLSDTVAPAVSAVVVNSGDANGLSSAQLMAMMSVDTSDIIASGGDGGVINWQFNSNSQTFDYLNDGESLELAYTLGVIDSAGGRDQHVVTITINGSNDTPASITLADQSSLDSAIISLDVSANFSDLDNTDVLSFSATGLPAGLSIDPATGVISGIIDHSASTTSPYSVTVNATDGLASTAQTFTWTVANPAPDFILETSGMDDDTYAFSAYENTPTGTIVGRVRGFDIDGDTPLQYRIVGDDFGLFELDASSGAIRLLQTIDDPELGLYTLSIEVDDLEGGTDTGVVNIELLNINDPPVALDDQFITDEDTALTGVNVPPATDVDSAVDANGYALVRDVSAGVLTFNADGSFSFDPSGAFDDLAAGESTSVTFTYTATDTEPDINGNTVISNVATITIEVTGINDIPTFSGDDTGAVVEDSAPLQLRASGDLQVVDLDNGESQIDTSIAPIGTGVLGSLSIDANGAWQYQVANADVQYLAVGETRDDVFTVTSVDGTTHDITVTIAGVNDTPEITVATGDSDTAAIDETETTAPLTAAGTLSVSDVDLLDTVAPSVTSVSVSSGDPGTLNAATLLAMLSVDTGDVISSGSASGQIQWEFSGAYDAFDYLGVGQTLELTYQVQATDNPGASTAHPVVITITGTNDTPTITTALPDQTSEDAELIAGVDVSVGFSDIDTGDVLSFSASGLPQGLSIDANTGVISGTIEHSQSVQSPFTVDVTATDASGASVTQSFDWVVGNPAPDFINETSGNDDDTYAFSADENSTAGTIIGTLRASDPDGDAPLTYTLISDDFGLFSVDAATGAIRLRQTIDDAELGSYTLTVTVDDGEGGLDTGTVNIDLLNVNDPPVALDANFVVDEDSSLAGVSVPPATDVDSAVDQSGYLLVDDVSEGMLTFNADGSFTFNTNGDFDDLAAGDTRSVTFTYTATDTVSDVGGNPVISAPATVTIEVVGLNDTPTFGGDDTGGVVEDASPVTLTATGTLLVNDPDTGESTIDTSIAPQPSAGALGSLAINSDGSWTYSLANADVQYLAEGETRPESFVVTSFDGTGHTIDITITGTNDAPTISVEAGDSDTADLVEADAGLTASGTLTANDVDIVDVASVAVTAVEPSFSSNIDDSVFLAMLDVSAGNIIASGSTSGGFTWSFDSGSEDFTEIPEGVTIELRYTVTVTDSEGAIGEHPVTISITGTDDKPVFTGGDRGAVIEDVDVDVPTQTLQASDQLTGFDPDFSQSEMDPGSVMPLNNVRGSLTITSTGLWNYEVANADVQYLAEGQVAIDIFQVATIAGDTHQIAVRITGANDAPVISVEAGDSDAGVVAETDTTIATSGTLSVTDVDVRDTVSPSVLSVAVTAGDAGGISNAALLAMFSVAPANAISSSSDTGDIQWSFASNGESFDYLADGQTLQLSYEVAATDSQSASDTHTVTIDITGTNDTPVVTPVVLPDQTNEDAQTIINVATAVGFDDIDTGDSLSFSAINLPSGLSIDPGTGVISGTLTADASVGSPYTVEVVATDVAGANVSQFFTWTVTNPAPDFVNETTGTDNDTYEFEVYEGVVQGTAIVAADDPDGDVLSYSIVYGNDDGLFAMDAATGEMSVTRAIDDPDLGVRQLIVRADDGQGGVDLGRVQVTLINVNDPPIVYPDSVQVNEDSTLNDRVPQATDVDSALDPTGFILQQDVSAGVLSFSADGSYLFDTNGEFESLRQGQSTTVTFTYITTDTATDFDGNTVYSDPATITIEVLGVNDTPTFSGDDSTAVVEDQDDPTISASGTLQVTDIDDSESVIDASRMPTPSGGALGSLTINAAGDWTYTVANSDVQFLAEGEVLTETHTVYSVDGTPHDIDITITGENDAPDITVGPNDRASASRTETDSALSVGGTLSVADVDLADTVAASVSAVTVHSGNSNNMSSAVLLAMMSVNADDVIAAGAGNGAINWQFLSADDAFDYLGDGDLLQLDYTVTATDAQGATDDQNIRININGTNDAPNVYEDFVVTDEDHAISGQVPAADDVDGNVVSYTTAGGPSLPAGLLTFNADGSYTVNPVGSYDYLALGDSTEFVFTYRAVDDDGGASDFSQVTVTINGVDDAPVVNAGSGTVREDVLLSDAGTLNAYDVDNPDLEFIADTYISDYGTLTVNSDGSWNYQLNQNEIVDAIALGDVHTETYTVALNGDGRDETPLDNNLSTTISINILGTNDAPEVPDLAFYVAENGVLSEGVSATDIDGTISGFALVDDTLEGQLSFDAANGGFMFNPNGDFDDLAAGEQRDVTFTYSAVDNNGAVATRGTVTITVVGVDNPPVVQGSSAEITEDAASDTVSGKLVATDVDDPTLAFGPTGSGQTLQGTYGSVVVAADGSWTYTLDNAAQATDELDLGDKVTDVFAVELSSGDGTTAPLTINITGSNDAPILTQEQISYSVNEEDLLSNQSLSPATDVDADDSIAGYVLLDDSEFSPGSLIFNTDGTFSVDPGFQFDDLEDGETGQATFTYRAFDSHGAGSQVGSVTITVEGFSDGEGDDNYAEIIEVNVPSSVSGGPLDNYTPGQYDDGLGYGTLTVNSDGTWSYELDPTAADPLAPGDEVVVNIPSGNGGDDVTIKIIGTNDIPVVYDIPCNQMETGENSVITGTVPDGFDVDGSVVGYSLVDSSGLQGGTITFSKDGTFVFDPGTAFDPLDEGDEQQISFTYQGIDNNGAVSNTASVCITIIGEDDPPRVTTGYGQVIEDDPASNLATGQLSLDDVDEDDSVSGSVTFLPQTRTVGVYGTFNIDSNGNWVYRLDNTDPDTDALNLDEQVSETFTVDVSNGSSTTVTIDITGANDVPVIDSSDSNFFVTLDEDHLYNGTLPLATDVDSNGVIVSYVQQGGLIYVADGTSAPGELTFFADGSYTFDPRGAYDYLPEGTSVDVSFTYRAEDNDSGVSAPATVTLTITGIDDLPVITTASATITEDDANPAASGQLSASDPDDGDDITFTAGTYTGTYGSVTLQADGSWEYNLAPNAQELQAGDNVTDSVTVDLSDGESTTVNITIKGINDVPTAADSDATVDEDSTLNARIPEATDVDGDVVAYRLVDGSFSGPGTIKFNSDGSYSYDPGDNFQALDEGDTEQVTFQYIAQDNSDGISDPITVTINVTGVNDAPTSSSIASQSSEESEVVSLDVSGSFDDIDADNVFTYTASGLPPSLSIDSNGVISGTLDADAAAGSVYSVTVTATDSGGEATSQSFSWTITNPAPDFVAETSGSDDDTYAFSLDEGTPSGTEVGVVSAVDPDGDTLTYTITAGNSAGWFAIDAATGAISLTTDVDDAQIGRYTLSVYADDGQGGSDTATVNIDLLNVNDPPVVTGNAIAVDEESTNTPLGIAAATDADGDGLTVTVTGVPDVGEVTLANGTLLAVNDTFSAVELTGLLYNAPDELAADYMGSFDFSVDDGQGEANSVQSASVDITVSAINDAPVAVDDVVDYVPSNSTGVVIDVLANDTDAENDDLTVISAVAESGTVTVNADGTLNYVPASGFIGTDNIVYQINDTQGAADTGNVTVNVYSGINPGTASAKPEAAAFAAQEFSDDDVFEWQLGGSSANDQPAAGEFTSSSARLAFADLLEDDDEDLSQWLPTAQEPADTSVSPAMLGGAAPAEDASAPYSAGTDPAIYSADTDASEFLTNHTQANIDL